MELFWNGDVVGLVCCGMKVLNFGVGLRDARS